MMNDGDDDDDTRPLSGRMSKSIELLTHIAAEMKTPKCDTRPLSCRMSESRELLTHIAAEMKTPRCGMPESIELYAQIGQASKTRKCTMSESTKLLTHIDAGRGQDPLEDACLERQRMRELNGLFAKSHLETITSKNSTTRTQQFVNMSQGLSLIHI